ncbi:hypothetical protein BD410DRAFT_789919 [Rickenella mellea]|uniref:Uncharacterized protein n=1 Tax=Rickenella mellea TaxID=50990 RepID=A0A4Y7Q183_9AGAM|nr:hypothetical protein BD410DRAFT_789919 [Rickenella mellea]
MDGVDELLTLLTAWKRDTNFAQDDVYGGHGQRCENPQSYVEPLVSLRRSLEESKRCMKALDRVRQDLGKTIRALRRRCMPLILHDGIRRMPDELLAHILEMGHASANWDESEFSLTASHVSHRLRHVALHTPVLWSRLSIAGPLDRIRAFISRSGHANLEVDLLFWHHLNVSQQTAFFNVVGPVSRRWSSITHLSDPRVPAITSAGVSELPNLRHLSCCYMDLTMPWTMPLLTSIQGYDCRCTPQMSHVSQLTSIHLRFVEQCMDIIVLSETFHAMRSMRDLSLKLCGCTNQTSSSRAAALPERHSFNMDTLEIYVEGFTLDAVVGQLYSALSYLAPSMMVISLQHASEDMALLHDTDGLVFPYGSTIRLLIKQPLNTFRLLEELSRVYDIVRSVYLVAPEPSFSVRSPPYLWMAGSSLRHLRIEKARLFPEDDVKILAKAFLSPNNDDRSRSLEFVSCETLSEDFFMELQDEVGDGLKWW